MKKLILVIAVSVFGLCAIAQDAKMQNNSQIDASYCAMLKDGKMMLMAEGKQVYEEVKLANGTIVKTDGMVIKSDKTKIVLQNGDCIDQDGNITPSDKKRMDLKDKSKETDYK